MTSDFFFLIDGNVIEDKKKEKYELTADDHKFIDTDFKLVTSEGYEKLKKLVKKEYVLDPDCVYKVCNDANAKKFFVVLQKQSKVRTNEYRNNVVDPSYAKFRADKLLVKQIIDLEEMNPDIPFVVNVTFNPNYAKFRVEPPFITDGGSTPNYAKFRVEPPSVMNQDIAFVVKVTFNRSHKFMTLYEVNKEVVPHEYCNNPYDICAGGIHYFKTMQAAFFLFQNIPPAYNGLWFSFDDNGKKN